MSDGTRIASNKVQYRISALTFEQNPVQYRNDSVFLTWKPLTNKSLTGYSVVRIQADGSNYNIGSQINPSKTEFADGNAPHSSTLSYKIIANFSSGVNIESNVQAVSIPSPVANLNPLSIAADGITLSWNKINRTYVASYNIIRKLSPTDPGSVIAYSYNDVSPQYTDKTVPYTPYVSYEIRVNLNSGTSIISNKQEYLRNNIISLPIAAFTTLYDEVSKSLYLFDRAGSIMLYNTDSKQLVKTINVGSSISYSDLGNFNGKKELYVPRNDGWVFIYDALTLEKIDQFSTGTDSRCVTFNNGFLYVSGGYTWGPIKIFNRNTNKEVGQTAPAGGYASRIKAVKSTGNEFFAMMMGLTPGDLDYYQTDASGSIILHKDDTYHGDYTLDPAMWEVAPSGTKMITGSTGTLYSKDMVFLANLPRGGLSFRAFAIDEPGNEIFAASNSKTIEVYSFSNYLYKRSYNTNVYSLAVHKDGNQIISIGSSDPGWSPTSVIVEFIK